MRTVYIDLSAKLEQWAADTVVAMTDGGETVLIVPATVKRAARDWLKEQDRHPRKDAVYVYRLLAGLVALIAGPEIETIDSIVIDDDYPGAGPAAAIKNELIPLLKRRQQAFVGKQVVFQRVKSSRADRLARRVFLSKQREGRAVTLQEIQEVWR